MRRIATYIVLTLFLVGASKAKTLEDEKGAPSSKADKTPAAKSDNSGKPPTRESEKGAVETEIHELRDLVQAQSEELRDLRRRLAAVEAERASSKVVPAPAPASPTDSTQPAIAAAASPVEAAPRVTLAGVSGRLIPVTIAAQAAEGYQEERKSPLSFKIGTLHFVVIHDELGTSERQGYGWPNQIRDENHGQR
jgi:hypothetical protein